ncbi:hypothetical protein [Paraburkholderia sediminicola]|uniref:hypothetical protein n=1 Tax=Paraburkholderia sediminicola TaxID=458836 RepID=UPI0038BD28F7
MNRKEIKAQVLQLLSDGVAKSEVFTRLAGQGVKDRLLAYFIAAHGSRETPSFWTAKFLPICDAFHSSQNG